MHPRRFVPRAEYLEDRTTPATLRIVQDPGGITGFGTAGTDPNNPSQTNSEFVTTTDLAAGPQSRTLGAVTAPVSASSFLNYGSSVEGGLVPGLPGGSSKGVRIDVTSQITKPSGLSGGGSTIYSYGLDPNVILAPITYEVVAEGGEQVGQAVTLSFGFLASGTAAATQVAGFRQEAAFIVNGARTTLISRNVQTGDPNPTLSGGQDAQVKIGDRFQIEFTQGVTANGINSATGRANLVFAFAVAQPILGAGVVGSGGGPGPTVKVFNDDGTTALSFSAFEGNFGGGVRVATGDVNGDGTPDVIAGTGPGRATLVRIFDGKTGVELGSVAPFEAAFVGGVYVAAGDLDGDGKAEVVVSPDEGGGPRVRVFRGVALAPLADFFGIDDPNFRGGARVAVGDLTADGRADLVVAAGFQGGPRVAAFTGQSVSAGSPVRAFADFFVFEQTLRNGVFVAVGDLDGDGKGDLVAGGGPNGGPRVYALSGPELASGQLVQKANFFAFDAISRSGVRVATTDLDGDAKADVLAGAGTGSRVVAYLGKDVTPSNTPAAFRDFEAFPGTTTTGVFVG